MNSLATSYVEEVEKVRTNLQCNESTPDDSDNKKFIGAVLMDLSKAFDCVPHDLLIAKMDAYGFDKHSLIFFYSYLIRGKQCVKINNV